MGAVDQLREQVIPDHAVDLVRRAADLCVQRTQDAASRRTGALVDGISHSEPILADPYVSCTITSAADYSSFQDQGTGIFGPSGMRIMPVNAKVLRFDWAAYGGVAFFRSVAGSPGTHFWSPMPERWRDALQDSAGAP